MTIETAAQAAYLVAALLFILALAGLSKHETAKAGNTFGIAGMAVALVATIALAIDRDISGAGLALLIGAMVVGAAIGLWRARVVEMTGMPELIALLHSLRGSGRGAGRLERLPARRGATSTVPRPRLLRRRRTCSASTPPRCSSASSSVRSPSPARSWRSSSCRRGSSPTR